MKKIEQEMTVVVVDPFVKQGVGFITTAKFRTTATVVGNVYNDDALPMWNVFPAVPGERNTKHKFVYEHCLRPLEEPDEELEVKSEEEEKV